MNLTYTQQQLFFAINGFYSRPLDFLMFYWTDLGDGLFVVAAAILMGIKKLRMGIAALLAFVVSGLLVQVLKKWIFPGYVRPWKAWQEMGEIHLLENFTPYGNNSFPSGHTTSAFCLFTLLILFFRLRRIEPLVLLLPVGVAWSRIYLSQHNFIDVYVGSVIGVLTALLVYYYFYLPLEGKKRWLEQPLHKIRAKKPL